MKNAMEGSIVVGTMVCFICWLGNTKCFGQLLTTNIA